MILSSHISQTILGLSGVAKVSCILHHRGIQLILSHSWARFVILQAGKGRSKCFYFCFFPFIPFACSSFFPVPLFHLLYCLFSPFLWETTQNDPQGLTCSKTQHNQSVKNQAIPTFPCGWWGAVDTNDWCITCNVVSVKHAAAIITSQLFGLFVGMTRLFALLYFCS